MKWAQKVKIIKRTSGKAGGKYPLPEGKPEVRNIFGTDKRWNTETGKYDIDA